MYPGAVSAPHIQSVPTGPIYAKFTLAFPLFAFSAVFLLPAVHLAKRFFILVVFLCHFLSIPHSQPLWAAIVSSTRFMSQIVFSSVPIPYPVFAIGTARLLLCANLLSSASVHCDGLASCSYQSFSPRMLCYYPVVFGSWRYDAQARNSR